MVLLLFSLGCSLTTAYKPVKLGTEEAWQTVERLAKDRAKVRTLRSFARLMLLTEGRTYRASVAVILERPDHFRVEFLGPFNHPRHILTFDGKTFSEAGDNNEIRLQDTEASGSTLSSLGLTPEWLVSAILGLPAISRESLVVDGAVREAKNRVRLDLRDCHAEITLWTKQQSHGPYVEKAVVKPQSGGAPVVEMQYSDFRDIAGQDDTHCRVPRIVTISVPERRKSLRIFFSGPEVNAELNPAVFRIGRP
ncbi:MAG: hypothetical protein JW759_07565 [Candidatus Coatesbacteria bacterium]|nr:hypothetical protein [Candidatus Coatesbacteria bacterium]